MRRLLLTGLTALAAHVVMGADTSSLATATRHDYPQWRNDGSGSAADSGVQVIDDITQAKVVWKSEEPLPPLKYKPGRAGHVGPSLANGALFIAYYERSGDFIDRAVFEALQKNAPKGIYGHPLDEKDYRVFADDILVCIDAATGKNRWRRVMKGKGFNDTLLHVEWMTNPCIVGHRVYFLGSAGRVYCLNTDNGEVIWESDIGAGYEKAWKEVTDWVNSPDPFNAEYRAKVAGARAANPCNFRFGDQGAKFSVTQAVATDKLLITGDGIRGLTALSLETGKPVWHRAGMLPNAWTSVTLWRHGDRFFVLHNSARGGVMCTDATTGEKVWDVAGYTGGMYYSPPVSGDLMLARGKSTISGLRMSPTGAEKLWETDAATNPILGNSIAYWSPVIHRGHAYLLNGVESKQSGYLCIDVTNGAVKAFVPRDNEGQAPLVAGDGLVFNDWDILKADPTDCRLLCCAGHGLENKTGPRVPVLKNDGEMELTDGSTAKFPVNRQYSHFRGHCNIYANGFYYYRGDDGLYCVDLRKTASVTMKSRDVVR